MLMAGREVGDQWQKLITYFNNPELGAQKFVHGEFFTGDLAAISLASWS